MRCREERARGDLGAISVLAALLVVVVVAFLALAINVGFIMHARGQLQNASDAAALAAAGSLDGTIAGLATGRTMALRYSQVHLVTGESVQIDPNADVEFGRWDFVARTFTPLDSAHVFDIDAVRVHNGRDTSGTHNTPLDVVFGGILGTKTASVKSFAVAVGRGSKADNCPMPFVLPSCMPCNAPYKVVFSNDPKDTVGFIDLSGKTGNAAVRTAILGRCAYGALAQEYVIQNGNDMNKQVVEAMLGIDGKNLISPAPSGHSSLCVFDRTGDAFPIVDTTDCPSPKFNQTATVAQFASVQFLEITQNKKSYTSCPTLDEWESGSFGTDVETSERSITLQLMCGEGNGLVYNSQTALRLVQ
jgi:hypothetical protein